jgi:hypothetical protein
VLGNQRFVLKKKSPELGSAGVEACLKKIKYRIWLSEEASGRIKFPPNLGD